MTFLEFCESHQNQHFQLARHHRKVIEKLDAIKDGGIVLAAWPPRSGKTTIAKLFSEWWRSENPYKNMLLLNYLSRKTGFSTLLTEQDIIKANSKKLDGLVIDDFFNSMDKLQENNFMQKSRNTLEKFLANCIKQNSPLFIIGTRMHYDDLFIPPTTFSVINWDNNFKKNDPIINCTKEL